MGATQSVLLYGAEVWLMPLTRRCIVSALLKCRGGERLLVAPAVMVIAGVIPVALLAKERKAIYRRRTKQFFKDAMRLSLNRIIIYRRKGENLRDVVAREERQRTLTEW